MVPDDPGLDVLELLQEVAHVHDQVADDREVLQGLDDDGLGVELAEEGRAGQPGDVVDHHPAGPAHAHPARPAIGDAAVDVVLDVVEGVEDDHVLAVGDLVLVEVRRRAVFGTVPGHLQREDLVGHLGPFGRLSTCARRAATG